MVRAVSGDTPVRRPIDSHRADERVETPYLQLVMTRLWEEEQRAGSRVMRVETLDRLGGACGCCASRGRECQSCRDEDNNGRALHADPSHGFRP